MGQPWCPRDWLPLPNLQEWATGSQRSYFGRFGRTIMQRYLINFMPYLKNHTSYHTCCRLFWGLVSDIKYLTTHYNIMLTPTSDNICWHMIHYEVQICDDFFFNHSTGSFHIFIIAMKFNSAARSMRLTESFGQRQFLKQNRTFSAVTSCLSNYPASNCFSEESATRETATWMTD